MRISEEEFQRRFPNQAFKEGKAITRIEQNQACVESKPNKFHAVMCEADNLKFPSKKHRNHYVNLKAMQHTGQIRFFLREVPFDLPGHYENGRVVRHYIDFMLCLPDGTYQYQEVKGRDLAIGKLKRAQVEELYGIKIEVI